MIDLPTLQSDDIRERTRSPARLTGIMDIIYVFAIRIVGAIHESPIRIAHAAALKKGGHRGPPLQTRYAWPEADCAAGLRGDRGQGTI
jgi:hypothetical protein